MNVNVSVEGQRELIAAFEKVQDGVADLRKLNIWLKVRQAFYRVIKGQFADEGSGRSGKWQELSSPYKEIKAKKYGNKPILQATGRLYRGMTGGSGTYVEEKATEMTVGTKVPYAGHHQKGTRKMPARPIVDLTDEQEQQVLEPIKFGLKQLASNARLRDLRGF